MPQDFKDWKVISRVTSEDGKVTEYTVQFYRPRGDGNWYDEIRYDSDETRKGRVEVTMGAKKWPVIQVNHRPLLPNAVRCYATTKVFGSIQSV